MPSLVGNISLTLSSASIRCMSLSLHSSPFSFLDKLHSDPFVNLESVILGSSLFPLLIWFEVFVVSKLHFIWVLVSNRKPKEARMMPYNTSFGRKV